MLTSRGERVAAINYSNVRRDEPDRELLAMYKNSWVVKKFIDKTADDMLKLPREFSGALADEQRKRVQAAENDLGIPTVFREADVGVAAWLFAHRRGDVLPGRKHRQPAGAGK